MMTDIEQMKAELDAEGYSFRVEDTQFVMVCKTPNGFHFTESGMGNTKVERAIAKAYAHLQERKELKALRVYVRARKNSDWVAQDLVDEYNITADDESDDDE